ncbi:cytokine-dependent hematopoietic cell linker [Octodon degus]|uniref:Cytokine-dependent hematopoietic cell linker n=1 Tax=Octodon degus TaxID=10160 RepID=A0A6P3ERU3_OCTDE|nr:cytokine-dependent hematopoietic cell linker [Octodon degus]
MAAVLDGAKASANEDYEDPELQMVDTWPSAKILPARPTKESEYADTRYFEDAVEASTLWYAKPSAPPTRQARNLRLQLEETPIPPPRPPPTLPKKYQPLPPAPPENHTPALQRPTFPEAQRGPRGSHGICVPCTVPDALVGICEREPPHRQTKPEPSHTLENQNPQKTALPITSSSSLPRSHKLQDRDYKGGVQSSCPQRCQFPTSCGPGESSLPTNSSWRNPLPLRSAAKDIQHNEWYVGERSRQVVEDALMQESKDGAFLVRDCSTKSTAEPYVLTIFYGNKVYNVKIRFLESTQKFALGTGLRGNEKFDSVEDIVEHYKCFPIILIDGKDRSGVHREQCYLSQPLHLARHLPPQ